MIEGANVSKEEFFMYLIIALVILAPVTARVYHYLNAGRVKRRLREQIAVPEPPTPPVDR